MFFQLLLIHLYRPFLKYNKSTSPLPQHVSPRKLCTQAAAAISKLLRLYKRTYGLKQICNIAVYIAHTALTIHLLNIPEKNAQRDVIHGLKHLEEMGEFWLCARRTLRILDISANKWQIQLPREAVIIFEQTHARWGSWGSWDQAASPSTTEESPPVVDAQPLFSTANLSPTPVQALGNHVANPIIQPSPIVAGPVSSQFPPTHSAPLSVSDMRSAQRSLSAQLARNESRQPEPTYLRPVSTNYNVAHSGQIAPQEAWYNTNEAHLRSFAAANNMSAASAASPLTTFDASENLVEESQDWWARDVNSLHLGAEDWTQGWNNSMPATSPDWRYEDNMQNIPSTAAPDANFRPPQPAAILATMPPNMPRPNQNSNGPGTNNNQNNIVFPGNFQQ